MRLIPTAAAIGVLATTAFAAAEGLPALSDGFPSRPITIIVPYGAGGGADQVTRALASAIGEFSNARFQIENKPGGGGLAAMPDFMSRPADAYTILEHDDGLISGIAAGRTSLQLGKDLEPICIVQATFGQIYIRPDEARFKDWESFLAYAKAHPGELSMANSGSSTAMEAVQTAALEKAAGIKTKQIGFDKPAERYGALIGGHTDVLFEQPGDVSKFILEGQMKPILTLLPDRPSGFDDVPALKDAGLESIPELQRVRVFWVRTDAPDERKAWLRKACAKGFKTAQFTKFNRDNFMHIGRSYYDGPDAATAVDQMIAAFRNAYQDMGILKK